MVKLFPMVIVLATAIWRISVALQVTPNSECAEVCMDEAGQDKSDPNVSNTRGSDIVCHDESYSTSPVGQKFRKCVSCLQNSTAVSEKESDLQWFLYNLRFAINSCVFGLTNASEPISSPCSINKSCGPLVGSLQDGMDKPLSSNRYSYCTAFSGSFLGPFLVPCERCLTLTSNQKYTGNFLVALEAGCAQLPEPPKHIGVIGEIFSRARVNVTDTAALPTLPSTHDRGLTVGAYAGISVAGLVFLLVLVATLFICYKKRVARRHRERLSSGLDDRFGNAMVTAPISGAYNDPNPPEPTAYQSHGPIKTPSSKWPANSYQRSPSVQTDEDYSTQDYQRPMSQHYEMSRGIGITTLASHQRTAAETPAPAYSPQSFSQRTYTPPSHTPSPSSSSIAHSRTHLNDSPASFETSNENRTRPAPMVAPGLPKPNLPVRSTSNATVASSYKVRPGRHTRDLSVGRGMDDRSNISGPIITVTTRFDEEEEARKRAERERLYREGFKKEAKPAPKEVERTSPDSDIWPGNY